MQYNFEKIVIVTKKTELEELIDRFNTESQARFYLEHAGQEFEPILIQHKCYKNALYDIASLIPPNVKHHIIERKFLSQYKFDKTELIIIVGPDGLVVNTAKYLNEQPMMAINPDPERIDGVLLPFRINDFKDILDQALNNRIPISSITLAEAQFSNGQKLLAFNDFFIGARTHISARYEIHYNHKIEMQSSSGIIISTGAGSTGWMRSVYTGAMSLSQKPLLARQFIHKYERLAWDAKELIFAVREPFPSKNTGTTITHGNIKPHTPLIIKSHMPQNGVIFSDGLENDFVSFNSGETALIGISSKSANLFVA